MKSLDSFISKVGVFAKTAEKKTQDVIEISQLKWKIVKIKSKIERKYEKLGSFTYLNYKNGDEENVDVFNSKVAEICDEIEELFSTLRKIEQEYAEIKEKPTHL